MRCPPGFSIFLKKKCFVNTCTRQNNFLYTAIAHPRKWTKYSIRTCTEHTAQMLSATWKLDYSVVFRCLLHSTDKSCKWQTKWGIIQSGQAANQVCLPQRDADLCGFGFWFRDFTGRKEGRCLCTRTEKLFMFVLPQLIVLELLIFTRTASSVSAEVYVLLEN